MGATLYSDCDLWTTSLLWLVFIHHIDVSKKTTLFLFGLLKPFLQAILYTRDKKSGQCYLLPAPTKPESGCDLENYLRDNDDVILKGDEGEFEVLDGEIAGTSFIPEVVLSQCNNGYRWLTRSTLAGKQLYKLSYPTWGYSFSQHSLWINNICNILKSTAFVVEHKSWVLLLAQAHAGSLYHLQPAKPYRWRYISIYMCVSSIIHFAISDAGARRQARGFRLRIRIRIRIWIRFRFGRK